MQSSYIEVQSAAKKKSRTKNTAKKQENSLMIPALLDNGQIDIESIREKIVEYLAMGSIKVLQKLESLALCDDGLVSPETQLKACIEFLNRFLGKVPDVINAGSSSLDFNRLQIGPAISYYEQKILPTITRKELE